LLNKWLNLQFRKWSPKLTTIIYLEKTAIFNYIEAKVNITINQLFKVIVTDMKSTIKMEAVSYSEMIEFSSRTYRKLQFSYQYKNALISNATKTSWWTQRNTFIWVMIPNNAHANTTVTEGIYNLISPQVTWKSNLHACPEDLSLKWELCSIFRVPYFNNSTLIFFLDILWIHYITFIQRNSTEGVLLIIIRCMVFKDFLPK
jgi:hypothetical protein